MGSEGVKRERVEREGRENKLVSIYSARAKTPHCKLLFP